MQTQFAGDRGPFTGMTLERFSNHASLEFFKLLTKRNRRTSGL